MYRRSISTLRHDVHFFFFFVRVIRCAIAVCTLVSKDLGQARTYVHLREKNAPECVRVYCLYTPGLSLVVYVYARKGHRVVNPHGKTVRGAKSISVYIILYG